MDKDVVVEKSIRVLRPFFSIVIPTYNSYEKLLRAIQSIHEQTYGEYEIIVVDDGSTDETKDTIPALELDKVRYFYKNNGGPASARNVGISHAQGKYVCFLDADDAFMPNKLAEFCSLCTHDVALIFSDAEYIDEATQTSSLFSSKQRMQHKDLFLSLLEDNFIVASTVCVKTTLLKTILFDENENLKFVEDYDLWLKIAQNNQLQYLEIPLTKYYIHASNNSSNVLKTYSSLIRIYKKWFFVSSIARRKFVKYSIVWLMHTLGFKK